MPAPAGTRDRPTSRSFLGEFLESRERRVPEFVEEVAHRRESLYTDRVHAARPLRAMFHEPGVLEHAQVARDRGATDMEPRRELADRERGGPQGGEDVAADGVSECIQSVHIGSNDVTIRQPPYSRPHQEAPDGKGRRSLQG